MGSLPSEWTGKLVIVRFEKESQPGVVGTVVSENAVGIRLDIPVSEPPPPTIVTAFIPWTAISSFQLWLVDVRLTELPELPRGF